VLKFVILGSARSGSTLLATAVRAHPAAAVFGELMNRSSQDAIMEVTALWPDCPYRHGSHAGELLSRWLFNPVRHAPHVRASGFKLFYDQAREDEASFSIWSALLGDRTVHILHVIRENLLQALTSLRTALKTDEWAVFRGHDGTYTSSGKYGSRPYRVSSSPVRFKVSTSEAEWFFKTVAVEREWVRNAFQSHPYLELCYDRLSVAFEDSMAGVFRFLRLPEHSSSAELVKQSRFTPRDQIENYEELREYFRRSVFAHYFQW